MVKKKIIMDKNTHVEFSAQLQELAAQIKAEIAQIVATHDNEQLLAYIESKGTPVVRFKRAPIVLRLLDEEEGLIVQQRGFKRFLAALASGRDGEPIFVLRTGEVSRLGLIHQFYKWYSMQKGMPGFDWESQQLFKKSMRTRNVERMPLSKIAGLKEAVARDREASDWAYEYAKAQDGTKQAFDKMNAGGANI